MAGLPAKEFLELEDGFERNLWIAISNRVMELRQRLDQNHAQMIANAVGKMLSGK